MYGSEVHVGCGEHVRDNGQSQPFFDKLYDGVAALEADDIPALNMMSGET